MTTALAQVKPFIYTNPKGLKLEVLFVLDPEKKGYINATAIAKQFDSEPKDWLRNRQVGEYIDAFIDDMNKHRCVNLQDGTKSFMSANLPTSSKTITYNDIVVNIRPSP